MLDLRWEGNGDGVGTGLISKERARRFLHTIDRKAVDRYEGYFNAIVPTSTEDIFRRALFAFASVHTTWQLNCKMYEMLAPLDWIGNPKLLYMRIGESGAGLHNNRFKYILDFTKKYWATPEWYKKQSYENWQGYRDRLVQAIPGLGLAKASFFAELVYFQHSRTACMDVHMLRLMHDATTGKFSQDRASKAFMNEAERAWVNLCVNNDVSPVTARWLYWDTIQNKEDSRYWSKVLEKDATLAFSGQMLLFPEAELLYSIRLPGAA